MKTQSVIILLLLFFSGVCEAQQVAFPGAEGFGMYTSGGRGGRVIKVTNLNDSGEGSLRAAIEASGPRIVVFEVSGTIALESALIVNNDDITIAGQTAPGDGICVRNYNFYVRASNVIIRYMRTRLGDEAQQVDDAMGGNGSKNVIIDHCSMSWSVDECASFYGNQNFTMQWCLIGESLRNSIHDKGSHGYGGIWGGEGASFHHNLLANHSSRNPRFCGSRYTNTPERELVDFRNNVIYNWEYHSAYGAEGGCYNMVNNYYKYGPATDEDVRTRIIHADRDNGVNAQAVGVHGVFYIAGNYIYGHDAISENNWNGGVEWGSMLNEKDLRADNEFDHAEIITESAEQAYLKVLEYAGASLSRDTVDKRTIHDTRTGTATVMDGGNGSTNGIIDTQSAVGGWPVLNSLPAPVDTDGDGMPDEWELAHGLDPNDPTDGNGDRNYDGYTNIEEYINSLALSYYDTYPFINTVKPRENEIFIAEGDTSIGVEVYSNDYNGGSVVKMELYLDDELIIENNDSEKIITTLENVPPGMHQVIVKATDDAANVSVDTTIVYVGTKEVKVTVEESPHGRVVLDPPGGMYTEGIDVEVTAIPDEGCVFHGWIKDFETTHKQLQIRTEKNITLKPVFLKDPEKKSAWFHPVKINFQPKKYAIPVGYFADYGGSYSAKVNGYSYGWIEGQNLNFGLNSGEPGVWKTYSHFEYAGNTNSWEIELPRGIYRIRLGLGGTVIRGWAVETELKINVEGILVEDDDGVDLVDEHILESVPVLDGQLTLTSVEQSRICFIEIELLELASPRSLTVENGSGGGVFYPDLEEEILVVADAPPEEQVFDQWTGDTAYLDDVFASTSIVNMPDADVFISATYKNTELDPAHYLIVVNGTGSGLYASGTEVEITAPETMGDGSFSHWEYGGIRSVTFDSQGSSFTFSMPDANVVLEPIYEMPPPGEGDIYQAEEAHWDNTSAVERYYDGYYGTGYVNFGDDRGSYVQFENIDGKEGGYFSIKIRYSLNDPSREGMAMINGSCDTLLMEKTGSWSQWDEAEVIASLEPGKVNTIRIETTGDDLGFIDQIQVQETEYSGIGYQKRSPLMKVSCYPNPFDDYAMISFELSEATDVNVVLYDLQVHIVRKYSSQFYNRGIHSLRLDKDILKPGLYFLSLTTDQSNNTIKILIY